MCNVVAIRVAWPGIVAFLPSHSACQLLQVAMWFFLSLPEHVEELCLSQKNGVDVKPGDFQKMITTGDSKGCCSKQPQRILTPRDYLKRFQHLKRLVLDFFDYSDPDRSSNDRRHMTYHAVVGALGVLFEGGHFPKLRRLEIRVVAHDAGEPSSLVFKIGCIGDLFDTEIDTCPFRFQDWLHQLAHSIAQAVNNKSLPSLADGHLCITDNFACAYFCNCRKGYHSFTIPRTNAFHRAPGDPYTCAIRKELARVVKPTTRLRRDQWCSA